jgi:NADPH2:quinone reductase
MKGKNVNIDLTEVMRKRIHITGSMLRSREVAFKTAIAKNLETRIWPLLASGQIKPIVYKVFAANEAAKAHELMESSAHMGKIVLQFAQ